MSATARGLFGVLGRVAPPADSDSALLDRYARTADAEAFAAVVRRHGPMVSAVCRRRLGHTADAEDAFQAVFLALAKSAGRVQALPAWLYRAAYLVALKAAGRRARGRSEPLPDEVPMPEPPPAWETAEVRAAVDAEVAGLPEKLRAVVVLVLLEGRTNTDAAAALGIPAGTVDSRLHAARKTLQARLTRRGVAVGAGVMFDQVLGGPVGAAGPRVMKLIADTIPAVLAEAARPGSGAVPAAVSDLSRGITTMTTNVRALAALGLAVGLLGTAGAGMYLTAAPEPSPVAAAAQEPKQDAPPAKKKADPVPQKWPTPAGALAVAALLDEKFGKEVPNGTPLRELLDDIEERTELIVRVDVAAFRRLEAFSGAEGEFNAETFLQTLYDSKPILPRRAERLPIRDVLGDALAQAKGAIPCTYQVRGNQLVIVPAYRPPQRPGSNPLAPSEDEGDAPTLSPNVIHEQIYGGVVSVVADNKPLEDILADLRKQTGANIVLDPRASLKEAGGRNGFSLTMSDVRLYDALRVIADMADLKMVYAGNIYYVTTAENARTFQPARPTPQAQPQPSVYPPGVGVPLGLGGTAPGGVR
ncbi:RNA polymerase sigma factor [Urbifossiella limnaea]|uniref:ECF RNA polymerase sigma factor SigE n=1 Tax=Urbifossiella limnaea TaxID=2528023 RepID=A0A517XMJ2_9BACT|nr:RNA polymerase sigma factor [Urbifossiella limnaea]QDU18702.1 ECF RNA polymerase sigma factor SigE [Urbifossiella limnaea]